MGAAAVPEAPPSWSTRIVTGSRESPGKADGAESPPAAADGSGATLGAPLAAGPAPEAAVLFAEDKSQGQQHHYRMK